MPRSVTNRAKPGQQRGLGRGLDALLDPPMTPARAVKLPPVVTVHRAMDQLVEVRVAGVPLFWASADQARLLRALARQINANLGR